MAAFDAGFRMGASIYQQTLDNRRRAEQDRLARERHDEEMRGLRLRNEEAKAQAEIDRQVRDIRQGIVAQDGQQVYDPGQMAGASGMSAPSVEMLQRGLGGYGAGAAAVDEALGDYARESARFAAAGAPATGLPSRPTGDAAPAPRTYGERDRWRDIQRAAILKGDTAGMKDADAQMRALDYRDVIAGASKAYDANPDEVIRRVQESMNRVGVKISKPDKRGFRTLIVGDLGESFKVSPVQARKAAIASALMQEGFIDEGLKMLGEVDTALAAEVTRISGLNKDSVTAGNDAAYKSGQLAINEGQLNVARARLGLERERAAQAAAANKQMPAEYVQQLNDLQVQIEAEKDPVKKRDLTQQWNRIYATGMSQIGRTVPLRQQDGLSAKDIHELRVQYLNTGLLTPDQVDQMLGVADPAAAIVEHFKAEAEKRANAKGGQGPRTAPATQHNEPAAAPATGLPARSSRPASNFAVPASRAKADELAARVREAQRLVAAAGRSGDPQSVQYYTRQYTAARQALDAYLEQTLGNGARAYLEEQGLGP